MLVDTLKVLTGSPGLTNEAGTAPAPVQIYDICGSILGKPADAAVVMRFVAVRAFSLPAGLTGSLAKCSTAATASTVLTFKKNGTAFGTATFAAAGTSATLAAASETTFAVGDVLTVENQATADTTFADAEITLVATLA